jgi:Holliday junction DNA helicase RuvB
MTEEIHIEEELLNSLRPCSFDEFVGQELAKKNIRTAIQASLIRQEPLDHVLLFGPPGLGKTSLARIIASELKTRLVSASGPALERPADLAAILSNLSYGDVLFIDEIHRTPKPVEEILYSAMEDFKLSLVSGQGIYARTVEIPLQKFTLVGATTRAGLLSSPLRDRFGIVLRLEFYSSDELKTIVLQSAKKLGFKIDPKAAELLGQRSRGTPRIANRILKRASDYALVHQYDTITPEVVEKVCEMLQIDENGLDWLDKKILDTIHSQFRGGPVGLAALSASVNEPEDTLEEVVEPYLLQQGFLVRTQRGRMITQKAKKALSNQKFLYSDS